MVHRRTLRRPAIRHLLYGHIEWEAASQWNCRHFAGGGYHFVYVPHSGQASGATCSLMARVEMVPVTAPDLAVPDTSRFHGGTFDDEIAGLLSLATGARFQSGGVSRDWRVPDDPYGRPVSINRRTPYIPAGAYRRVVIPRLGEQVDLQQVSTFFEAYRRVDSLRSSEITGIGPPESLGCISRRCGSRIAIRTWRGFSS